MERPKKIDCETNISNISIDVRYVGRTFLSVCRGFDSDRILPRSERSQDVDKRSRRVRSQAGAWERGKGKPELGLG